MKLIYSSLLLIFYSSFCIAQIRPYKTTVYDTSSTGYYFLSSLKLNAPGGGNDLIVLDRLGDVVFYAPIAPGIAVTDFKLQPNGLISCYLKSKFYLFDSTFTIKDSVECKNGLSTDVHDLQILPNGHYLLIGEEVVKMDLSSYNYFKNGAYGNAAANVTCSVIQELDALRNVVFEWHLKDYFSFDSVDKFYLSSPVNVDWTHCNAVELDADGNILLSTRHFNEITKINRSDSSIMWRMGGKYNQFTFLNSPVKYFGQHDIRRIANGHVTLYDNGDHPVPHGARALEYALDETNKTADLQWSYTYDASMYSRGTGNAQRLPNSNTLIDWGLINKNNLCFMVVKPTGDKVFELAFDDTLLSYRVFNYPTLPFKLNRPVVNCSSVSGNVVLDAGSGYPSYLWSNGETTQTITVTAPDTFYVSVPYGVGFMVSEKKIITNLTTACSLTGVSDMNGKHKLKIMPNPTVDYFRIEEYNERINGVPEIYNTLGERIQTVTVQESGEIDCKNLAPGVYMVKLKDSTVKFIKL